eukprot:7405877-Alexandrium_andersonii.AAC.1
MRPRFRTQQGSGERCLTRAGRGLVPGAPLEESEAALPTMPLEASGSLDGLAVGPGALVGAGLGPTRRGWRNTRRNG